MKRRSNLSGQQGGYRLGVRYAVFLAIVLAIFAYLYSGIIRLQILDTDSYTQSAENSTTTTIALRGSRPECRQALSGSSGESLGF